MLQQLARDLAYAIVKAMLLRAIMGLFGGGGGSLFGVPMTGIFGQLHTGGIVGKEGAKRFISLLPRYHSGGLAGDEQLAVLREGEGVFTPEQMKALGQVGGTTIVNLNIKAIDAKGVADFFTENRGHVESIVTHNLYRNGAIRSALRRA